jgi:hypothetical protein
MYGMINVAIKELIMNKFGNDKWSEICTGAQIDDDEFKNLQYYPDSVTYNLVASASKALKITPEAVLQEFGKYWISHTASAGYGPIMDLFGNDFITCLKNLNNLHARMGLNLPNLKPPRFELEEIDAKNYILEYYSTRVGLDKMVVGLLNGLADKFKTQIQIQNITIDTSTVPQKFEIKILTAE